MNSLIELRQRSRGYELVETEDDYESVPPTISTYNPRRDVQDIIQQIQEENTVSYYHDVEQYDQNLNGKKEKQSNICIWFLFLLSISGVIFLTTIGVLLKSDSLYLKVSKENEYRKPILGDGVVEAAMLYVLTAVISGYYLFRSNSSPSSRFSMNKDSS